MPRPRGHQLLATRPMEVIAADFLAIKANRRGGYKYVLIVVDQLTRICICVATMDATAATAARILCDRWLAFFPEPAFIISDGGPHFKADLFREITDIRGFNHHIIAPYSQWANGGVKRLNYTFSQRLSAIINATKSDWSDWPAWVPAIQEALNKRIKVQDRGNVTPMELLMGMQPKGALRYVAWLGIDAEVRVDVDPNLVDNHLQDMHQRMPQLWARASAALRARRVSRQNKPGVTMPRIHVDDLVLVAEAVRGHKLRMRWTGPHEVTAAVNKFCYRVQPILPAPQRRCNITAHIVRIRRFANAMLHSPADRAMLEESARRDFPDNFVKRFVAHRRNPTSHAVELRVRWLGFDRHSDTWESIASLIETHPEEVEGYLRDHPDDEMLQQCLRTLF